MNQVFLFFIFKDLGMGKFMKQLNKQRESLDSLKEEKKKEIAKQNEIMKKQAKVNHGLHK
jgi:hypothetical protein